jgi:hypothetical protein
MQQEKSYLHTLNSYFRNPIVGRRGESVLDYFPDQSTKGFLPAHHLCGFLILPDFPEGDCARSVTMGLLGWKSCSCSCCWAFALGCFALALACRLLSCCLINDRLGDLFGSYLPTFGRCRFQNGNRRRNNRSCRSRLCSCRRGDPWSCCRRT